MNGLLRHQFGNNRVYYETVVCLWWSDFGLTCHLYLIRVYMKTLIILLSSIIVIGCSEAPRSLNGFNIDVKNQSYNDWGKIIVASNDETDAFTCWNSIKSQLDFEDEQQVSNWLCLQKLILESSAYSYPSQSLKRQAIQEFYLFYKHSRMFENWLRKCKNDKFFQDPFVNKNIDAVLNLLEKTKDK